jgi:hypothetical protein
VYQSGSKITMIHGGNLKLICPNVILSATNTIRTYMRLKTDFRDGSSAWANVWPGLARLLSCVQNKTSNVRVKLTLRGVLATFVAVEKQKVLHIVSLCLCLRYQACNAHAPDCHLWQATFHNIFPHCQKRKDFRKKVTEQKICVLISSTTFFSENISHSNKNWVYIGLHARYPLFLSDFNETWIFTREFRKILKYQI